METDWQVQRWSILLPRFMCTRHPTHTPNGLNMTNINEHITDNLHLKTPCTNSNSSNPNIPAGNSFSRQLQLSFTDKNRLTIKPTELQNALPYHARLQFVQPLPLQDFRRRPFSNLLLWDVQLYRLLLHQGATSPHQMVCLKKEKKCSLGLDLKSYKDSWTVAVKKQISCLWFYQSELGRGKSFQNLINNPIREKRGQTQLHLAETWEKMLNSRARTHTHVRIDTLTWSY